MLHFFRRIRKRLLDNDSLRKYLFYAIGEVILVVIGILIALQLNNWNERRKADNRVQQYLVNLSTDLEYDIGSLDRSISINSLRLYGVFYLLEQAELNTDEFTEIDWYDFSLNDGLHGIWDGSYPTVEDPAFTQIAFCWLGRGFGGASFNRATINELYSTGSFSNIEDESLKANINEYYRYLNMRMEGYAIEEHEEWANEVTRFFRDSYGIFTLDVSGIDNPIGLIRGKKDVEHHLRYLALEINYHLRWAAHARTLAKNLRSRLEEAGS